MLLSSVDFGYAMNPKNNTGAPCAHLIIVVLSNETVVGNIIPLSEEGPNKTREHTVGRLRSRIAFEHARGHNTGCTATSGLSGV